MGCCFLLKQELKAVQMFQMSCSQHSLKPSLPSLMANDGIVWKAAIRTRFMAWNLNVGTIRKQPLKLCV